MVITCNTWPFPVDSCVIAMLLGFFGPLAEAVASVRFPAGWRSIVA
jgi:hypothetical protein